jgi:hypothetical protein
MQVLIHMAHLNNLSMNVFIETITSTDPEKRNRSFYELCRRFSSTELFTALQELDTFRKGQQQFI